jgi:glycerol kinase
VVETVADDILLAIDQGTSSTRAMAFSAAGDAIAVDQQSFEQLYPGPGWVEHDAEVIWATVISTCRRVLQLLGESRKPTAIGITNQRETTVLWDRRNGVPIHPAIVWQDRRTADRCRQLSGGGGEEEVCRKTGLRVDPYFSATKIAWILDHVKGAREAAERGHIAFGTIDSFLIWRLTGGRLHLTDATNASRTALYDIGKGCWDDALCELFDVPRRVLPEVRDSAGDFGVADASVLGQALPISGVAGDQQSALVGQSCFAAGDVKSTYGTGAFLVVNTAHHQVPSKHRLLTTIAYRLNGTVTYALEGSILSAGAAVQWLRDGLGLISQASDVESLAGSAPHSGGVYVVPAFTGLGAPYWDPDARAAIVGLTRASTRSEIARATLDSVAYQTADLLAAMSADGQRPETLKVDGGMAQNALFMQRLADVLGMQIRRPIDAESTAFGAACLAGLGCGVYRGIAEVASLKRQETIFEPSLGADERASELAGWRRAVQRVRSV